MRARVRPYDVVKRGLDAAAAAVGLVVLGPVLLVAYVVVTLALGHPAIFKQQRPGRHGVPFTLLKFRSMRSIDAARGRVSNEERMTRFGRVLRATSIDEIPSLWNIFVGDMSFVGPRPLRLAYLERYSAEQQRRHSMRPGLTGLAQVSGRNALTWDDRLRLDQEYVEQRSLLLDARILFLTAKAVITPRDVAAEGQATMSEFFGPESTSRLSLAPLAEEHLETRVSWLNDDRVRAGISISFAADIDSTVRWFASTRSSSDRWDWVGVTPAGVSVSMCGLLRVEESTASLYIYVDPDQHKNGFGRDTMSILIANARRLGFDRLELETPADNEPARRLYESLGFSIVGTREDGKKLHLTKDITAGHANG
ncbi:GNAT family N-acetyltransferase [Microbacterium sp. ISL-59]|nr:GNAT family N-acetyltransferase [Microbacterium sp. ISL-59]